MWWLGLFTRRLCPSLSHVAHVGPKHWKGRVGEVELRLGWLSFSCLQGGGKVGRGFDGEKVSVGIGISRRREGILAMLEHGARVVGSEVVRLGSEV